MIHNQMDNKFLIHGVLPGIGSAMCFAVMASLIKLASDDLHASQLVFFRSIFGLLIILPVIIHKGSGFLKTKRISMHGFRALVSLCAMTCFFYAIGHIGLSESTLLNATSPLFIGLLASLLLGENLDKKTTIALLTGFLGVALILKPGTSLFNIAALIGLASGFFIAGAKTLVRYMSDTEPVFRTVFYFSLFSTLYSAVPLIWVWQSPSQEVIFIMAIAAVCATGGQTLLTYAFTHNEAISVAPFTYFTVLFATLIGWVVWDELPDLTSSIGAILVITSCILISISARLPNPWAKPMPKIDKD